MVHALIRQYGDIYHARITNDLFGDGSCLTHAGYATDTTVEGLIHYIHGHDGVPLNNISKEGI